jgi:hypothetical protein
MTHLDTKFPTIVFKDLPLIDPDVIKQIMALRIEFKERQRWTGSCDKKLNRSQHCSGDKYRRLIADETPLHTLPFPYSDDLLALSIRDVASGFLDINGFKHIKDIWYMECIAYKLDNEIYPIKSGLPRQSENYKYLRYDPLITVFLYLRKDKGIKNGNLKYKNKNDQISTIEINSGTTIIMDGRIEYNLEDTCGTGDLDLIIVSFHKM